MTSPGKSGSAAALLLVASLLGGTAAHAYTIEAVAAAFNVGHPDAVGVGESTMNTNTTQLFFDTGLVSSTFGTRVGDPPNTAQGLASAALSPGVVNSYELGVLASSTGDNLVAHAGARARIDDILTISLPAGTPTATIGVTFTITGFDLNDGGLIDEFFASISTGTLSDARGMAWGAGDLIPDLSPGASPGEIVPLVFSEIFTVSQGELLVLSIGIDARTDGSQTLDFSSTGGVSFALPPDVTLTSQTGMTFVPEPGSLALIGFGLAGLAAQRRRGSRMRR